MWGCEGATNGLGNAALPNDQTTGPISRTLCAALNRGTLGTSARTGEEASWAWLLLPSPMLTLKAVPSALPSA